MTNTVKDGGPAFPSSTGNQLQHGQLSVRDWYAGMALQGLLACPHGQIINGEMHESVTPKQISLISYEVADAMIAAREGKK